MTDKVRCGMRFYVDVDSENGILIYSDNVSGHSSLDNGKGIRVTSVSEIGATMQKYVEHNVNALKSNAQKIATKASHDIKAAEKLLGTLNQ